MEEQFTRGWGELLGRETGVLHLRVVGQPLGATVRPRRPPRVRLDGRPRPPQRSAPLRRLRVDAGTLCLVAVVRDVIYQVLVLRWFYPVQTLIVATALAVVPDLLVRGLTNRVARRTRPNGPAHEAKDRSR